MDFGFATAGMTEPNFSIDPLGTEGELTPGPDDENPFDEQLEQRQREAFELPVMNGPDFDHEGDEADEEGFPVFAFDPGFPDF